MHGFLLCHDTAIQSSEGYGLDRGGVSQLLRAVLQRVCSLLTQLCSHLIVVGLGFLFFVGKLPHSVETKGCFFATAAAPSRNSFEEYIPFPHLIVFGKEKQRLVRLF